MPYTNTPPAAKSKPVTCFHSVPFSQYFQVASSPGAVDDYVERWVLSLHDITDEVVRLRSLPALGAADLPDECPYPLPRALARRIGASPYGTP